MKTLALFTVTILTTIALTAEANFAANKLAVETYCVGMMSSSQFKPDSRGQLVPADATLARLRKNASEADRFHVCAAIGLFEKNFDLKYRPTLKARITTAAERDKVVGDYMDKIGDRIFKDALDVKVKALTSDTKLRNDYYESVIKKVLDPDRAPGKR